MRTFSSAALLSASLLLAACGDKQPAKPAGEATTPATTTANPASKLTDTAGKLAGDANAQIEAAKGEVAKYQAQVDGLLKDKAGLETKLADAQKSYDKVMADAKAQTAPLQAKVDELNKQIKTLEGLPGLGGTSSSASSGPARAGFDLGGLANTGSGKLADLKAQAAKYQTQIDQIMGKAKEMGLPYTEQIASYTGQLKSLTESLTKAQGMLDTAKQNLASLTAPSK